MRTILKQVVEIVVKNDLHQPKSQKINKTNTYIFFRKMDNQAFFSNFDLYFILEFCLKISILKIGPSAENSSKFVIIWAPIFEQF